jgi:hypothetical protein
MTKNDQERRYNSKIDKQWSGQTVVCPDHCLSFWLLYRLSWSLFVIFTVVLSVLIIVCHFDCCIVCPDHCLPFWLLYRLSFDKRVMITPCWCLQTFLEWHSTAHEVITLSNTPRMRLDIQNKASVSDMEVKSNIYKHVHCEANVFKIGMCCFSAEHSALRSKNKDWLA